MNLVCRPSGHDCIFELHQQIGHDLESFNIAGLSLSNWSSVSHGHITLQQHISRHCVMFTARLSCSVHSLTSCGGNILAIPWRLQLAGMSSNAAFGCFQRLPWARWKLIEVDLHFRWRCAKHPFQVDHFSVHAVCRLRHESHCGAVECVMLS